MTAATDLFNARHNLQISYLPIKNTSGSAILAGTVVKLDASNPFSASNPTICVVPTAALTDVPLGVTVETSIAAGAQGTAQDVDGTICICFVDASGNITAGTQVMPSSSVAGAVRTYVGIASPGNSVVGQAMSSTTATADPVFVKLQLRGGI